MGQKDKLSSRVVSAHPRGRGQGQGPWSDQYVGLHLLGVSLQVVAVFSRGHPQRALKLRATFTRCGEGVNPLVSKWGSGVHITTSTPPPTQTFLSGYHPVSCHPSDQVPL